MTTTRRVVVPLRILLALAFAALLVAQVGFLPALSGAMAQDSPELAYLRWPLTAVTVFWVVCIQVVIVSTWKLLTLVKHDRIFSDAASVWVDAIVWAIAAAWVVLVGLSIYVVLQASDPGVPLLLFLMVVGVAALGLLMVVMRALLRQATTLRTDMQAVI